MDNLSIVKVHKVFGHFAQNVCFGKIVQNKCLGKNIQNIRLGKSDLIPSKMV